MISYNLEERKEFGSGVSSRLRKNGKVPVSIYISKSGALHGLLDLPLVNKISQDVSSMAKIYDIHYGKKSHKCIIKHVSHDPVRGHVNDIEFICIDNVKTVDIEVPIKILNIVTCPGIKIGGKLNVMKYNVLLRCDVKHIPECIEIDIASLAIGRKFNLSQITLPKGVVMVKDCPVVGILGKKEKDDEETTATSAA